MLELQRNFNQGFTQSTEKVFTTPAQRNRFNQLYYQYQGYGAFNDLTLREKLKLNNDQTRQLNDLERNWQRDMNGMSRNFATDRTGASQQYTEWSRKHRDRLNEIWNEDQQKIWSQTTGDPYDFPADIYFPKDSDRSNSNEFNRDK